MYDVKASLYDLSLFSNLRYFMTSLPVGNKYGIYNTQNHIKMAYFWIWCRFLRIKLDVLISMKISKDLIYKQTKKHYYSISWNIE